MDYKILLILALCYLGEKERIYGNQRKTEGIARSFGCFAAEARALLVTELKAVMDEVARIGDLKPETADEETYNKLVAVVQEANSIATLRENLEKLGKGAVLLFKEMAAIAKGIS